MWCSQRYFAFFLLVVFRSQSEKRPTDETGSAIERKEVFSQPSRSRYVMSVILNCCAKVILRGVVYLVPQAVPAYERSKENGMTGQRKLRHLLILSAFL